MPISLVTPSKVREILNNVKTAIQKTNPDYNLVIDRLHLYCDVQLVTFAIDSEKNRIIQFQIFVQPYTQQPLILYQLETVPVLIIDRNTQAQCDTHLQIAKPYIALNSETYTSIRQQELRTCKKISYEFYCEELFVVKCKSRFSCESTIYFNLNSETIKKKNANLNFTTTKQIQLLQYLIEEMKLSWQIGQMISTSFATFITTYQVKYQAIHMC